MRSQIHWGVSLFIVLLTGCSGSSGQIPISNMSAGKKEFSPVRVLVSPAEGSENFPLSGEIEVWFSRPIDVNTVSTGNFVVTMNNGLHLPGKVEVQPQRASFRPLNPLKPGVFHHAQLREGISDTKGLPLEGEWSWSFRTSSEPSIPLKISKLVPADLETSVSPQAFLQVFFEDFLEKEIAPGQFILLKDQRGNSVQGEAESIGRELRFRPADALELDGVYEATVLAGVPGEYGKKLQQPHSWSFSVQPSCSTLAAVNDCNQNGIPDGQEFQQGTANDCNGNCIPDECELPKKFRAVSEKKGPIGFGFPQNYFLENLPQTAGDVDILISGQGDFSTPLEYVEMTLNGVFVGDFFQEGFDCSWINRGRTIIDRDFFNSLIDHSGAEWVASAIYTVDPAACGTQNHIQWTVEYPVYNPAAVADCNANGIPDSCDLDSDQNGIVDDCESLQDGSFESQEPGFAPGKPWEVIDGSFHSVESFSSSWISMKMPVEGKQYLLISSQGSVDAAAGISQAFRVFPSHAKVRFSAMFMTSEKLGNSQYNDFLSVDLSDGTTAVNLLYLDTFSVFDLFDATAGNSATPIHHVEVDLRSLFPNYHSETKFTLTAVAGNVGDGAYDSWGFLDGIVVD